MTACPKCRSPLIPGLPESLCPRCLLGCVLPVDSPEPATTPHAGFVPPTPAELAPLFPQLEILQLLGQGGMGAVYKARQVKLDRLVALKVLPPAVARDPGCAARFGREARALAKLNHPHIVAVHDFGDVNGLYYLVMEFVEGVNLRQALAAGKLEPKQALALVTEICSALQYAHENGVVHRDVKPENVLLGRDGHAKIADFGLAKIVGVSRPERLTGTHQAMGTPHYMAPEQWERPLEVDHRADIYSLGVVFYELLTGELPLGKFAPPSQKAGDPRLDQVVLRAIEKEPSRRYQHMSEMRSAVESVGTATQAPVILAVGTPQWIESATGCSGFLAGVAVLAGLYYSYAPINWLPFFLTGWFMGPLMLAVMAGCAVGGLVWSVLRFGYVDQPLAQDTTTGSELGLAAEEMALWLLLRKAARKSAFSPQLTVLPDFDGQSLAAMRQLCGVPADERVLGMLDLDQNGVSAGVCFGCRGVYWRNGVATSHPGPGSLTYQALAGRRIVNHGFEIYLDDGRYLCPDEENSGVAAEAVAGLLYQVRSAVGGKPA